MSDKIRCNRCTMSFEVGKPRPGPATYNRCPDCNRQFWDCDRDASHARVGIRPERLHEWISVPAAGSKRESTPAPATHEESREGQASGTQYKRPKLGRLTWKNMQHYEGEDA